LVVQNDAAEGLSGVVLCPLTSDLQDDKPAFRIDIAPSQANGLFRPSQVMVDKPNVVARDKLRDRIGQLTDAEMDKVTVGLTLLLALT
jgi:mRNA interferase MazF